MLQLINRTAVILLDISEWRVLLPLAAPQKESLASPQVKILFDFRPGNHQIRSRPVAALLTNPLPLLGHLTEPLEDQQQRQSASSMYTKPQCSHDPLYTCCLWLLVGGNARSTPPFQRLLRPS